MCPPNIVFWCFVFFVALFSKSQGNSTNNNERSDYSTIRYEHLVSSMKYQNDEMETTQCNACENSIKNDDEIQYELSVNSTKSDHKNDDSMQYNSYGHHIIRNRKESNQMSIESRANLTEINSTLQEINKKLRKEAEDESNSTNSNKFYENSSTDDYNNSAVSIVSFEACHGVIGVTCIQLCCPFGNSLTAQGKCVAGQGNYSLPKVFTYGNDFENTRLNKLFRLTVRDPCVVNGVGRKLLDEYVFLTNGFLFQAPNILISPMTYCLAPITDFKNNVYYVIVCTNQTKFPSYISVCLLVSLPFLLLTFVVYSILPELQNMHGYTLRAHVASLFVTYAIMYFSTQISGLDQWRSCIPLAYIFNFSFLSSFFWLNVTCFDIWWTFRQLRSYQIRQDKKKFVMYSLYAWGITFILNVICAIMDYAPGIPKNLIRPQMCEKKFWFGEDKAKTIYFYIPMCITIISNIFFFIATMVTILYQNIYTTNQLRDSESNRHNENKQRFIMYFKLFIVMGISWVMEIILWFVNVDFMPAVILNSSNIINSLQGVIIFIIFVCKKKIMQLLLKKFSGRNCSPFCKIPTNNDSMASTTFTSASGTLPMQEINSSN